MLAHTVIEQTLTVTPLGIRFWDAATETQVRDGLQVTARPATAPASLPAASAALKRRAFRTLSGVYAFQGLPGLHDFEYPDEIGPAPTLPPSLPDAVSFVIEVHDAYRRFVPVVFEVELPLRERGVFPFPDSGSLPGDPVPGFYLFPSAVRKAPSGLAVVRARLIDAGTGEAAAHAVLEVEINGERWLGVADDTGRAVVMFPYPVMTISLAGSPPEGGTPLHEHDWPLAARVRYHPAVQAVPAGSALPTLQSIVAQGASGLYSVAPDSFPATTPVAVLPATLRYGEEAILRTQNQSVLLIEPTSSIP